MLAKFVKRLRRAIISLPTRPILSRKALFATVAQSGLSSESRPFYRKFFVSKARRQRKGRPMSRSSAPKSASKIRKFRLRRSSSSTDSINTLRNVVQTCKHVYVWPSLQSIWAFWYMIVTNVFVFPILFNTAHSAMQEETMDFSSPSFAISFAVRNSLLFKKATLKDEAHCSVSVVTRPTTLFSTFTGASVFFACAWEFSGRIRSSSLTLNPIQKRLLFRFRARSAIT